mgnify:CR=1 FL=1
MAITKRGRKAPNSAMVPVGVSAAVQRPAAPLDLMPEESDEWARMVDAMPADWFPPETWNLLSQHCRHVVQARRISQLLDQAMARDELDIAEIDKLLTMQKRETEAMRGLSASMRTSQQASYSARGAAGAKGKRPAKQPRPWET